jgi:hypothetical protein
MPNETVTVFPWVKHLDAKKAQAFLELLEFAKSQTAVEPAPEAPGVPTGERLHLARAFDFLGGYLRGFLP